MLDDDVAEQRYGICPTLNSLFCSFALVCYSLLRNLWFLRG